MLREFVVDRSGRRRELLPGEVLRDGETLVVGVHLMDGKPTEQARVADEVAAALAADGYERELCDAWRGDAARLAEPAADAEAAFIAYDQHLRDAWRGGR